MIKFHLFVATETRALVVTVRVNDYGKMLDETRVSVKLLTKFLFSTIRRD